ncbi:MAG: hypothetical protein LBI39_03220 [Puniceicoccales bacterium]|jgi:hypothetical protein|nr:hypothetical protein [Puniceicoccales bacterium]
MANLVLTIDFGCFAKVQLEAARHNKKRKSDDAVTFFRLRAPIEVE